MDRTRLTSEQAWYFRMAGFVKLPGVLPDEVVEELKAAIDTDIAQAVQPVVRNRAGRIVRLSNILDRAPIFRAVATSPLVLDPLVDLLGPNIELLRNRHNHATLRLPEPGGDYLHRDVPQWSRGIVTVLFYLEAATCERGCTQVIPASHLLPWPPDAAAAAEVGLLEQVVRVEMPAGGLLAIDSLLWHGAGRNLTGETRTSMTLGYHSADDLASVADPQRILVRGQRAYAGHSY
ncbi:MAG TPA: phytanoyl-CoA dioxygenase family protein [Chloroflexota bacterium]|nr:phytanoyl-CoA dioxygenase family protein [Chloroflexota bacterium]